MARFEVIPRLPELFAQFPNIQVELGATDRNVDLIREGYDCVIRGGELTDSSLISKRIGAASLINVASAGYLRKHGTPRSLKDLERHYLVQYVSSFGQRADAFEYLDGENHRSLKMRSLITVNNAESYVAAGEAGLGIIQSPAVTLQESLHKGTLVEILPKLKIHHVPRRIRIFIDWIERILSGNYR